MFKRRAWKKHAYIMRVELQSGDVQFRTYIERQKLGYGAEAGTLSGTFESLTDAEQDLNKWFAEWWPKQIKSSRRA